MPVRKLMDSFNYALDGIIFALRTQRNMRIHLLITLMVILLCMNIPITKTEIMILTFCISLVFVSEMINTAIEAAIDLFTKEYHELAKIAKNVAAGAVLIAAFNSVLIGYLVFMDRILARSDHAVSQLRGVHTLHIFFILVLVTIAVVFIKFRTGGENYFQGGFPSGHTALAASLFTIIALESGNPLVVMMGGFIALLVGQSRYEARIHNLFQIIAGGLLGILLTLLAYKIFIIR